MARRITPLLPSTRDWRQNGNEPDLSSLSSLYDINVPENNSLPPEICDLRNNIHPIFHELNFPSARYDVLRPILQLATLLLDTDCLLDFWHTIFSGDREVIYDTAEHQEWHIEYGRGRPYLSAKDRAATRLKLVALSHKVKFYRDDSMKFLNGECTCAKGNVLNSMQEVGLFRRRIDRIGYNENMYQEVCRLHDTAMQLDGDEIDELHLTYLYFAITPVHEVAHAAAMAEIGDQYWAVFEGSAVAQEGYDWENYVFGGTPAFHIRDGGTDRMTLSSSWPCASLVTDYLSNGTPICLRDGYIADGTETWFYVRQASVRQSFRSKFWDVKVASMGAAALRLPMDGQFRLKVDSSGSWTLLRPHDKDAERFDRIPEGWHVHKTDGAFMYLIHESSGINADGFARPMRISFEGIWGDEQGLKYRLEYPQLPKRPPAQELCCK